MNKKGFIAIPLLITIIASIIAVSTVAAGVVLYKQGNLKLGANISESIKEDTEIVEEPEVKSEESQPEETTQEEDSQQKPEPEVIERIVYKDDPVLKATIQALEKQVQDLLNKDPEVKEVIKEVPVEKIVYVEPECPPCECPEIPITTDISCSTRSLGEGYIYYVFRTKGEDFIFQEVVFYRMGSFADGTERGVYYSINGEPSGKIGRATLCSGTGQPFPECIGTGRYFYVVGENIIFPKDSEIIVSLRQNRNFQIRIMRFKGATTGKIISLP